MPCTPRSLQATLCSKGAMNSSYTRSASAPYFSTTLSGVTTLPLLLLIFWPSSAWIMPWLRRR